MLGEWSGFWLRAPRLVPQQQNTNLWNTVSSNTEMERSVHHLDSRSPLHPTKCIFFFHCFPVYCLQRSHLKQPSSTLHHLHKSESGLLTNYKKSSTVIYCHLHLLRAATSHLQWLWTRILKHWITLIANHRTRWIK